MQNFENDTQILDLFPTPIYTTKLPQHLSTLLPWLYEQEMLSDGIDSSNYGDRSKNSYLLNEPNAFELSNFLLSNVKNFGKQLGYVYEEYRFTQSWISVKYPGQHHSAHSHPNSLISGVFFFGESTHDIPAIQFHKMITGVNVPYISAHKIDDKDNYKYSQEKFSIGFEPGLVLLFPSSLYHSVPLNNTEKPRFSLAFNTLPKNKLGEEGTLTEFLYQ